MKVDYANISSILAEKGLRNGTFSESMGYDKSWFTKSRSANSEWTKQAVKLAASLLGCPEDDVIYKKRPVVAPEENRYDLIEDIAIMNERLIQLNNRTAGMKDLVDTVKRLEKVVTSLYNGMSQTLDPFSKVAKMDPIEFAHQFLETIYRDHDFINACQLFDMARMSDIDRKTLMLALDEFGYKKATKESGKGKGVDVYYRPTAKF